MTLTQLKYILAVAKTLNFHGAADACHVSQPTLTTGIKTLEDQLGVRLFDREKGKTGVTITAVGREVLDQAEITMVQAMAIKSIAKAYCRNATIPSQSYTPASAVS